MSNGSNVRRGRAETIREYLQDRIRTLWPVPDDAPNPFSLLAKLTKRQWAFFMVGFWAWAWDAFDFYSVPVLYKELGQYFKKAESSLALTTTLVLISRAFGAAVFGAASDVYGRKWPFVVACGLLMVLELSTGFCRTYSQFIGVRALFGLAMGGIYGNAAATALEDTPDRARGLFSGMYQGGYPFGFLLATAFKAILVDSSGDSDAWRRLYWFGSGPPILLVVGRLLLKGDTETFENRPMPPVAGAKLESTLEEVKIATGRNWLLLLYLFLLLSGLSYLSHGSQDLYPLMLQTKYPSSPTKVTLILVTAYIGAMVGSVVVGYGSQIYGRRFSIIIMCIVGGALLYFYTFTTGPGIFVAGFLEQFCVQGAWGVIPIYLIELAPSFRTFVVGTSYHVGTMVAAASNSIEAKIGERYPMPPENGVPVDDYRYVVTIFCACAFLYVIAFISIGPERKGRPLNLNFL